MNDDNEIRISILDFRIAICDWAPGWVWQQVQSQIGNRQSKMHKLGIGKSLASALFYLCFRHITSFCSETIEMFCPPIENPQLRKTPPASPQWPSLHREAAVELFVATDPNPGPIVAATQGHGAVIPSYSDRPGSGTSPQSLQM